MTHGSIATRKQTFRARGKLMLTGEYLVLDGAEALAVPTALGQRLDVTRTDEADVLLWRSYAHDGALWLERAFSRKALQHPPPRDDRSPEARVARLLHEVLERHPLLWPPGTGLRLETRLEFARDWGLGSSATLVYLLAAWGATDAFALNAGEFGGSGYDVACAGADGPLLYRLTGDDRDRAITRAAAWYPAWMAGAWLVHLGRKQDSRAGIAHYRRQADEELGRYAAEVTGLTEALLVAETRAEAAELLRRHEALVGYVTHQVPLGRATFAEFPGVVKSLGAWGGDFALALPTEPVDVVAWFGERGYDTVLPAEELLVLDPGLPGLESRDPRLWPVFLHGELAQADAEHDWLAGLEWTYAELLDYGYADDDPAMPVARLGSRLPGMLVFLPASDILTMDLHPAGRGYRRSHALVRSGSRSIRAQVWLAE